MEWECSRSQWRWDPRHHRNGKWQVLQHQTDLWKTSCCRFPNVQNKAREDIMSRLQCRKPWHSRQNTQNILWEGGWSLSSMFHSLNYFKQLAISVESRGLGVERKRRSKIRYRVALKSVCPQKVALEHLWGGQRCHFSDAEMAARTDEGFDQRAPFLEAKAESSDHTAFWEEGAVCSDCKWRFIPWEFERGPCE